MDYKTRNERSSNISLTMSKDVKSRIESWLNPINFTHEDFPKVLESVGVTGEALSVVEETDSCKCVCLTHLQIMSDDNKWDITLYPKYGFMMVDYNFPTIEVKSKEQEATYIVYSSGERPITHLLWKKQQHEATMLSSIYYSHRYEKKLCQGDYELTVNMCEPETEYYKKHGEEFGYVSRLSRSNNEVEKYLFSLDLSKIQKLDGVWNKIKSIMELSDEEFKMIPYIHLILEGKPYVPGISLAKISYNYANLEGYAENNNGQSRICIGYSEDGEKSKVSYYQNKYSLRVEWILSDSKTIKVSYNIPKEDINDFDLDVKKIINDVTEEIK